MKKIIRIDVARTAKSFVFVEFDDMDTTKEEAERFGMERIQDSEEFWRECSHDYEVESSKVVKDAEGYEVENMPKPTGWRLGRIKKALGEWEHVTQLELVDDRWLHRTVKINDMLFRSTARVDLDAYVNDDKVAIIPLAHALRDTFELTFDPKEALSQVFT